MEIKSIAWGICLLLLSASVARAESDRQFQSNTEATNLYSNHYLAQINRVSQLKDVSPDDWAYEALRSLSERYNCINGFADGTFRGQQTLTRYQFAAGLNSCLQQIENLITSSETIAAEDLQTFERLRRDFEVELATLAGRVDNLEARVATLEDNQFSTTTILNGEVIFALTDAFGGDPPGGCSIIEDIDGVDTADGADCVNRDDPDTETVLTYTARLGLQSSFTGKDRLRMYLTSGNFDDGGFTNAESLNTYMARLGYQAGLESDVSLDILEYRFPTFNDKLVLYAAADGFALSNLLTANSPYFDIGRGSISRFGQLNPILRIGGAMDAGIGFDWSILDSLRLQAAYGTRDSGDTDAGFFGADHSALGVQLLAQPTENIVTGINYVNAYSSDGVLGTYTGSVNAETGGLWSNASIPAPEGAGNSPFSACCRFPLGNQPAQINAVGGSIQWNVTEKLNLAAWGGYAFTDFLRELPDFSNDFNVGENTPDNGIGDAAGEKPFAESATFTVSLGLSDLFGREGDQLGFIFGMPPKLVDAGPEVRGVPVPFFEQVIDNEGDTVVTDNNPNLDTVGKIAQRVSETGESIPEAAAALIAEDELPTNVGQEDEATSLHFELFYRFKVNDNISITPGMFVVTNPGHIKDNDTIYVGTLRTTFRF
ncbi:MAG: iron uptake porin [Pleurocapsa sp. MO_226.B13]|nr:iron uptake porin [Pleurocapsa sp. MO_226.B13]